MAVVERRPIVGDFPEERQRAERIAAAAAAAAAAIAATTAASEASGDGGPAPLTPRTPVTVSRSAMTPNTRNRYSTKMRCEISRHAVIHKFHRKVLNCNTTAAISPIPIAPPSRFIQRAICEPVFQDETAPRQESPGPWVGRRVHEPASCTEVLVERSRTQKHATGRRWVSRAAAGKGGVSWVWDL